MFCPSCGGEYRVGFESCFDCEVDLVQHVPESSEQQASETAEPQVSKSPDPQAPEMVSVFESGNVSDILVAKSLLEGAGIRYFARGDQLQDLFGLGWPSAAGQRAFASASAGTAGLAVLGSCSSFPSTCPCSCV